MKGRKRFGTIFTLGLLSAMGAFSIDMYLPGFPEMAADLNSTVAHITLSITSFFIGVSFGQLIYGPLIDKYGYSKPLYIGLSIYILASIGCAHAPTSDALIWIRLLQALGSCAGMVAARALVRIIFPVNENAKVFSLLMLVIALSPIIAPTLGGYISVTFGWKYIFYVLAAIGVISLIFVKFTLPKSSCKDEYKSLKPLDVLNGFMKVIKVPRFYTYAIAGAIASSGLYAYIAGSPFVFMSVYGVSEKNYGLIFAMIASGLIISSQINTVLLKRITSEKILKTTLLLQCITGIALAAGAWLGLLNLYSAIILIIIFLSTQGFAFPNSSALSLAPFSKNAGMASALMGAIQMGMGVITTALVSIFNNGTVFPMALVMCLSAILSFTVLIIGTKNIKAGILSK